jgi:VCBS repeat-containing protein
MGSFNDSEGQKPAEGQLRFEKSIGRIGALAVALGVGFGLGTPLACGVANATGPDAGSSADGGASSGRSGSATASTGRQGAHPRRANGDVSKSGSAVAVPEQRHAIAPRAASSGAATSETASPRQGQKAVSAATDNTGGGVVGSPSSVAVKDPVATARPIGGDGDPGGPVRAPITLKSIVTDALTWIGLGGLAPSLPIPDAPVPPFFEGLWLAVRGFQRTVNNQRPGAHPALLEPDPDGTIRGNVNATDFDGDSLTYSVSKPAAKGEVSVDADGSFTYKPGEQITATGGKDTFTIRIDDGATHGLAGLLGLSGPGSTTITVTVAAPVGPVNHAPTNGVADVHDPDVDGKVTGIVTATDPDGDTLKYSRTTLPSKGSVVVSDDGSFTYTPTVDARHGAAANGAGVVHDGFTVTATDGKGGTLAVLVSVVVRPVNAAPGAVVVQAGTPNLTTGVVTGSVHATDADNDTLTYTVSAQPGRAKNLTFDSATGAFSYTPTDAARQSAAGGGPTSDVFTVTITDGHGGSATTGVNVTVAPINRAPINGVADIGVPGSDGKVTGTVSATDPDGNSLSYSGTTTTSHGAVVVNSDGSFTYSPTPTARHGASANGAGVIHDGFSVTVSDGNGGTLAVPVSVVVSPKNSAPGAISVDPGSPNAVTGVVTGSVHATDADQDTLTYTVSTQPGHAQQFEFDSTTGSFTYKPTGDARHAAANGGSTTDSFAITITDGYGGTTTTNVSVTVAPAQTVPNQAPRNLSASITGTGADGIVSGLIRAADPDGDLLTFTGTGETEKGQIIVWPNGSFKYVPNSEARHNAAADSASPEDQADNFSVTVSDGAGGVATLTVSVPISAENALPTGYFTVGAANQTTGAITGRVIGGDVDGDQVAYVGYRVAASCVGGEVCRDTYTSGVTSHGSVVINPDGTFTYTPNVDDRRDSYEQAAEGRIVTGPDGFGAHWEGFGPLTDSFSVAVLDGHGGQTVVPVRVVVAPLAPAADAATPAVAKTARISNAMTTADVDAPENHDPGSVQVAIASVSPGTGAVTGYLAATDPDGDTLTYTVTSQSASAKQVTLSTLSLGDSGTLTVFTYTPTDAARQAATNGGPTTDTFTITVADGHGGTVTKDITVTVMAPVATITPTVTTIPNDASTYLLTEGPLLASPTGTAYQLVVNLVDHTVSVAVMHEADPATLVALPGLPLDSKFMVLRPDGDLVVTTVTADENSGLSYSTVHQTQISRITAAGDITTVAIAGSPTLTSLDGLPVMATDGTVYQLVRTTVDTGLKLYDDQPFYADSFVVVGVDADGAFTTNTLNPGQYGYPAGPLLADANGSVYQSFTGYTISDDGFGQSQIAVLKISATGSASVTDWTPQSPFRLVGSAIGPDDTRYVTFAVYDDNYVESTVVQLSGGASQAIVGHADQRVSIGADGSAYQVTQTSDDDGNVTVHVTKIGGATADIDGVAVGFDQQIKLSVASDGGAFLMWGDDEDHTHVAAISPGGGSAVVTLDNPADGWTGFVLGAGGKVYLVATDRITAITTSGIMSDVALGGTIASSVVLGPNGIPYVAVVGDSGYVIKNLATGTTSDPVTAPANAQVTGGALSVGPDGSIVFVPASPLAVSTLILTLLPDGSTATTDVLGSASSVTFGPDGTEYLSGSGGLVAITSAGAKTYYPGWSGGVTVAGDFIYGAVNVSQLDGTVGMKLISAPGVPNTPTGGTGGSGGCGANCDFDYSHKPLVLADSVATPDATGAVHGRVSAVDVDGDTLTYSVALGPVVGHVILDPATGEFTYVPDDAARHEAAWAVAHPGLNVDIFRGHYIGTGLEGGGYINGYAIATDRFSIAINDGHGGVSYDDVTVDIAPANIKPTVVAEVHQDGNGLLAGTLATSDADSDDLSVAVIQGPDRGNFHLNYDGTFIYTPAENMASLSYTDYVLAAVSDGHGAKVSVVVAIPVNQDGGAPPATSPGADTAIALVGLVHGSLGAGMEHGVSYEITDGPAHGTAFVYDNGTYDYLPDASARAQAASPTATAADREDRFTVIATDEQGLKTSTTVTVAISPKASDPINYEKVVDPAKGTVNVFADGRYQYTPSDEARAKAAAPDATDADRHDTFTVKATDVNGNTTTMTVTVSIAPPDVTIPVGDGTSDRPYTLALNHAGTRLYVGYNDQFYGGPANHVLSVIDTDPSSPTYNTVVGTVPLTGLDGQYVSLTLSPSGTRLYAGLSQGLAIIDIDPTSGTYNQVIKTVDLKTADGGLAVGTGSVEVRVSADGKKVYVVGENYLSVINTDPASDTHDTPIAVIDVGVNATGVALTATRAYVVHEAEWGGINWRHSLITVIDIDHASPTYNTVVGTLWTNEDTEVYSAGPGPLWPGGAIDRDLLNLGWVAIPNADDSTGTAMASDFPFMQRDGVFMVIGTQVYLGDTGNSLNTPDGVSWPGIAVTADGRVYLSDPATSTVTMMGGASDPSGMFGTGYGFLQGHLDSPVDDPANPGTHDQITYETSLLDAIPWDHFPPTWRPVVERVVIQTGLTLDALHLGSVNDIVGDLNNAYAAIQANDPDRARSAFLHLAWDLTKAAVKGAVLGSLGLTLKAAHGVGVGILEGLLTKSV